MDFNFIDDDHVCRNNLHYYSNLDYKTPFDKANACLSFIIALYCFKEYIKKCNIPSDQYGNIFYEYILAHMQEVQPQFEGEKSITLYKDFFSKILFNDIVQMIFKSFDFDTNIRSVLKEFCDIYYKDINESERLRLVLNSNLVKLTNNYCKSAMLFSYFDSEYCDFKGLLTNYLESETEAENIYTDLLYMGLFDYNGMNDNQHKSYILLSHDNDTKYKAHEEGRDYVTVKNKNNQEETVSIKYVYAEKFVLDKLAVLQEVKSDIGSFKTSWASKVMGDGLGYDLDTRHFAKDNFYEVKSHEDGSPKDGVIELSDHERKVAYHKTKANMNYYICEYVGELADIKKGKGIVNVFKSYIDEFDSEKLKFVLAKRFVFTENDEPPLYPNETYREEPFDRYNDAGEKYKTYSYTKK